jgi:hypothetical protein
LKYLQYKQVQMQPSERQNNKQHNYNYVAKNKDFNQHVKLRISIILNLSQRSGDLVRILPGLI